MKKVLLALALIVFNSPAYSIDSKGNVSAAPMKCDEVIEAHAGFEDKGSKWVGNSKTWQTIGYIQGYFTAKNIWKIGKKNWFKGKNTLDLLHWTASYCRSNPSHRLDDALEVFSEN